MAPHYLLQRIAEGESEVLDFKKTISSASKIAKTICAFANHKGGTLLVGVNDNKTISGVRSEDELYMLDLAAQFYVKPEISLKMVEWEMGNKVVIEAIIPEGIDKPYYAKDEDGKWWAHIRVKDQSLLASKIVLDVLKRNSGKQPNVISYTKHEESLLKYLEKNERITLKELCKMLNISRWRAQKMLVSLVSAGILRNHTTEKTEFFTLS
ncbi:MAG: putative DNA binding domain-containing protein [Bacteroidetes bacterium]|nr:putative DNA binding domain-containing protein [Bacteroidota bacterium]